MPLPTNRHLAAFTMLLLLDGCGTLTAVAGRFDPPELRIHRSWIRGVTPTTLAVSFTIDLDNPNRYALQVQRLRYSLIVDGEELGAAENSEPLTLPGRQTRTLELPLTASLATWTAVTATLGEMPYELRVTLSIEAPWFDHSVEVSQRSVLRIDVPLGLASGSGQDLESPLPRG